MAPKTNIDDIFSLQRVIQSKADAAVHVQKRSLCYRLVIVIGLGVIDKVKYHNSFDQIPQ